jgi:hypothetical protein
MYFKERTVSGHSHTVAHSSDHDRSKSVPVCCDDSSCNGRGLSAGLLAEAV